MKGSSRNSHCLQQFLFNSYWELNIQQAEKGDATSIPNRSFPGDFPNIKIIPNAAKSIIYFLKPRPKKNQVMMTQLIKDEKCVHLSLLTH
jgi:hypothetical protein